MEKDLMAKVKSKIYDIQKRIIYVDGLYQFTAVYFDEKGNVLAYDDLTGLDIAELAFMNISEQVSVDAETLLYELKLHYSGLSLPIIDIEKERQKNNNIKAFTSSKDYFDFIGVTDAELQEMQQELLNFVETKRDELKNGQGIE